MKKLISQLFKSMPFTKQRTYHTQSTTSEILGRISNVIPGDYDSLLYVIPGQPFLGSIGKDCFKVWTDYGHTRDGVVTFVASGKVKKTKNGSVVDVMLRYDWFMMFFFMMVFCASGAFVVELTIQSDYGMAALILLVTILLYWVHLHGFKQKLKELESWLIPTINPKIGISIIKEMGANLTKTKEVIVTREVTKEEALNIAKEMGANLTKTKEVIVTREVTKEEALNIAKEMGENLTKEEALNIKKIVEEMFEKTT